MMFDRDILDTMAVMAKDGAKPRQVLESLRPARIDPEHFIPDWDGVALALAVARRRIRMNYPAAYGKNLS